MRKWEWLFCWYLFADKKFFLYFFDKYSESIWDWLSNHIMLFDWFQEMFGSAELQFEIRVEKGFSDLMSHFSVHINNFRHFRENISTLREWWIASMMEHIWTRNSCFADQARYSRQEKYDHLSICHDIISKAIVMDESCSVSFVRLKWLFPVFVPRR
jgi:hypothetical protein